MKHTRINKFNVSIRIKIIVVIIITILFALLSYFVSKNTINKYAGLYENEHQSEYKLFVKTIFNAKYESIKKTSDDYCCYDWMVEFIQKQDTLEALQYISSTEILDVDILDIYNIKRKRIYRKRTLNYPNLEIKIDSLFLNDLYTKRTLDYFEITEGGYIHIIASTIHYSSDTQKKLEPHGFLILAKVYDHNILREIEKSINSKLTIIKPDNVSKIESITDIPLKSYNKEVIAGVSISKDDLFNAKLKFLNSRLGYIFIFYVLILCLITIFAYNIIIIKPLSIIQTALNLQSDKVARKLMYKRDEFGKISRLIIRFFQQRKLLDDKLKKLYDTKNELKCLNNELTKTAQNLTVANDAIVQQQKAMTDNIYYASAVQRAALIPSIDIEKVFREHFIIFKPRDIVSGDFYWFYHHQNKYFVATADCTGHGLSGSLMSMLGISFLNQIINQSIEELTAAGILKKLREFIVQSLHQQGASIEVYDGMDIGLCIFDFKEMIMEYAAAYNPLYLLRYNEINSDYELVIYKGDSMPVGIHEHQINFSNHTIPIQKNDLIYLFTDGYIDQFGGPDNKKFMSKRLRELLLENAGKSLTIQKEIIITAFENWRGKSYQVDDVTMIALKI